MNDFKSYSAAFHAQNDDITHFGILGMKWGVRRYQNKDGSLTPLGKKRRQEILDNDEIKDATKRVKNAQEKNKKATTEYFNNHKRFIELNKKKHLSDKEYKELELITQVEARKALEKYDTDVHKAQMDLWDLIHKYSKGDRNFEHHLWNEIYRQKMTH